MSARPGAGARLADGGLIDRTRTLRFRFDGREYAGHPGDTLASALLAHGVHRVARSFKYHRSRGILSAGFEEPNALVELGEGDARVPNTPATTIELFEGLDAQSQNRWPSLRFDLRAVNRLFSALLPAGFYYKTFMWPAAFWERVYEPAIRRAAGLGRASGAPDPATYERSYGFCDVLVVGAGPAGLAAALGAARAGARVWLVEADCRAGGRLLAERLAIGGEPALRWVEATVAELESMPTVRVLRRATAVGRYDGGVYAILERVGADRAQSAPFEPRERLWHVVARHGVLASGAIEQPLVFENNDLPGILLAGAVRAYANRYAVLAGRRVVVATSCDDAWATARDLLRAGASVEAIVDQRPAAARGPGAWAPDGVPVETGWLRRARGRDRVRAVEIEAASGRTRRVACDAIAMSGGWAPQLQLATHLGERLRWDGAAQCFAPESWPPDLSGAGAVCGEFGLAAALAAGARCGTGAARALGFRATDLVLPAVEPDRPLQTVPSRAARAVRAAFVDWQNDVTIADVQLAVREGFAASEHLKRYTTLGMATDQGKTSSLNGLIALAEATGRRLEELGPTTHRPPVVPVTIGALAGRHRGRHYRPTRLPPAHAVAADLGAVFVETGPWLRAQVFPRAGDRGWLDAMCREVNTVRRAVGVCDVSTLGKVDVQGADAPEFLERVYASRIATLAIGRVRYALMRREDGFVMDDGTVARLGERHYLLSTTTAGAVDVYRHLQYCRQVLWPDLDVRLASVTDQWAQFAVAGPRSRELLGRLVEPGIDLADPQFPLLAAGSVRLGDGTAARLFRVSFCGELAYELAVPARAAHRTLERLFEAGAPLGVAPYGLEALGAMRIEKGHVAGNEINGQTTAADLGLGRWTTKDGDSVGAVLARRPGLADPQRPRLAGFVPVDRAQRLGAGAHLIALGAPRDAAHDEGYLSSVAYSPTLGHWIGLGFLRRAAERVGERVLAHDPLRGRDALVEVVETPFVDPRGERLRG